MTPDLTAEASSRAHEPRTDRDKLQLRSFARDWDVDHRGRVELTRCITAAPAHHAWDRVEIGALRDRTRVLAAHRDVLEPDIGGR